MKKIELLAIAVLLVSALSLSCDSLKIKKRR